MKYLRIRRIKKLAFDRGYTRGEARAIKLVELADREKTKTIEFYTARDRRRESEYSARLQYLERLVIEAHLKAEKILADAKIQADEMTRRASENLQDARRIRARQKTILQSIANSYETIKGEYIQSEQDNRLAEGLEYSAIRTERAIQ